MLRTYERGEVGIKVVIHTQITDLFVTPSTIIENMTSMLFSKYLKIFKIMRESSSVVSYTT